MVTLIKVVEVAVVFGVGVLVGAKNAGSTAVADLKARVAAVEAAVAAAVKKV
jgi:hypothetical protein